ncbi:MAG TPA: ribosome-associated translation inhibitor RaiA [Chloroflexota bacterium]|nr:ribosome-associated translation inhibitor RaiA [Chloroflexota bacterium]
MRVLLTGKNMVLTDAIEHYATQKFSRLARHRPKLERAEVELTLQATREIQDHYVCQANLIEAGHLVLRGEASAADPRVAIDALLDLLEQQLERQHERVVSFRRSTAEGHLPPTPEDAFVEPSTLEVVLSDYGIDARTISHLQERGIRTMEQLRAAVDDGHLAVRLGPGYDHQARDLTRVIEKLRL